MEEQPRKLETVISVSQTSLYSIAHQDIPKDVFHDQAQELVFNENVLLQTLGFDVAVDHPHTHVVRTCQLVKGTVALTTLPCNRLDLLNSILLLLQLLKT